MTALWLVRHAMPHLDGDVAAEDWELCEDGHAEAKALASRIPRGAQLVASNEPKAWQTLAPAGDVRRDDRLGEVRRDEPFGGPFRVRRRAYVEGATNPGWEPRSAVAQRFQDAVDDALSRPGMPVMATHGMALAVWLHARGALAEPGEFWSQLACPQVIPVDVTPDAVTLL